MQPAPKKNLIGSIIQWLVTGFFLFMLLILTFDIPKLSLKGAPVVLFGVSLALLIAEAILHSPKVFFRLPLKAKLATYAGILLTFVVMGNYLGQMSAVYDRTPAGRAEAEERQSAAVLEAEAAAARAEAYADAVVNGNGDVDSFATSKDDTACTDLVSSVIEMSKGGNGPEIIEINDVRAHQSTKSNATCTGEAITSRGKGTVEFGTEKTPQGNELLISSYPYGLN